MSAYVVTIGGREYAVSISTDGIIAVEGSHSDINVYPVEGDTYSVLIGNVSSQITVRRSVGQYEVFLGNNHVDVSVDSERDQLLKQYATSTGIRIDRCEIHAPMPALVVRVEVNVGDEVKEGQGLLILEAMKMENEIKSHQTGKVKEIFVTKGKSVEKGELLMLLE